MDPQFWHQRWQRNEIGFHQPMPHPMLLRHADQLPTPEAARIFVPLCGKTRDIEWLLSQGYQVVGVELSELAIEQLFSELNLQPNILQRDSHRHYCAPGLDILVGDFFMLTAEILGPVDMIYDRAALVALPSAMRTQYTQHLIEITQKAPQLMICYDYDPAQREGPPFAIADKEVHQHYIDHFKLSKLESSEVTGGLKAQCPASENVWLLINESK